MCISFWYTRSLSYRFYTRKLERLADVTGGHTPIQPAAGRPIPPPTYRTQNRRVLKVRLIKRNQRLFSESPDHMFSQLLLEGGTWRIIPVSNLFPIYTPFSPFGRETTLLRGLTNHGYWPLTSTGMILQVRYRAGAASHSFPGFGARPGPGPPGPRYVKWLVNLAWIVVLATWLWQDVWSRSPKNNNLSNGKRAPLVV